jgi:hypothetical protein
LTLDNLLPDSWPDNVVAALDLWRQGHLVRCAVGTWLARAGDVDFDAEDDFSGDIDELLGVVTTVSDTGYSAVIFQTCDIAATGPGARHPTVQICPVRNVGAAFSPEKISAIRGGEVVEYVYLTNPPEPGQDWAIDLRMSMPLSKRALALERPINGFASEEDELYLASRIAAKFERPALHDYLAKDLVDALNGLVLRARKNSDDWYEDVEQMRLVVEGNRLYPKRVRLVVVTDVDFNGIHNGRKKALRDHWKSHKRPLKAAGIDQAPISFRFIDKLTAKDYRSALPLTIPALGRGRFD